jgi:hypothetical protein
VSDSVSSLMYSPSRLPNESEPVWLSNVSEEGHAMPDDEGETKLVWTAAGSYGGGADEGRRAESYSWILWIWRSGCARDAGDAEADWSARGGATHLVKGRTRRTRPICVSQEVSTGIGQPPHLETTVARVSTGARSREKLTPQSKVDHAEEDDGDDDRLGEEFECLRHLVEQISIRGTRKPRQHATRPSSLGRNRG